MSPNHDGRTLFVEDAQPSYQSPSYLQPLSATFSHVIVKGCLGRPQPHHQTCLSPATYLRLWPTNTMSTHTYFKDPINGAQIDVKYWVESSNAAPTDYIELKLIFVSATVGYNNDQGGLSYILEEMKCPVLMTECTMTALGFSSEDITHLMKTTEIQLLEPIWHTTTASQRALNTFEGMGLEYSRSWCENTLKSTIDSVWWMKVLGLAQSTTATPSTKTLSPEATVTWEKYLVGEDLRGLPAHTFTRHRKSIKQINGVDIAIKRKARTTQLDDLSKQLSYKRRWEPSGAIRKRILCEGTASAMIKELHRGLEFLRYGVIPDLDGEDARNEWLVRWGAFADREGGRKKLSESEVNECLLLSEA